MRPKSAGSSYFPTASSRPLEGTSTAAELPPSASAAAWATASSVAARESDCPRTEAIRENPRWIRAWRALCVNISAFRRRKRRETRERLENVRVAFHEAAALAPADAEHAAHLVAPGHRRGDHVGEAIVGRMRDRRRDLAVGTLDQRPTLSGGRAGEALARRELEAEQRGVETVEALHSGRGRARGRGGSSPRRPRRAAARAGRRVAGGRPASRDRC